MKTSRSLGLTAFFLLAANPTARAFLGDDFAAVEGHYGAALARQGLAPGLEVTVHETVGYRVMVLYREGRSQRETFYKLAVPFDFTDAEIDGFLKAHADGERWERIAGTNSVQTWERPGAAAFYVVNGDKSNLAFERLGTAATLAAASSPEPNSTGKTAEKGLTTGKLSLGGLETGKLPTGKLETGSLTTGPLAAGKLQAGKLSTGKLEGAGTDPTPSPSPTGSPAKVPPPAGQP